ncbi:hypothetical protein EH220_03075, partial [bacterium]
MDSNDGDDKTEATIYFARIPAVITTPPMTSSLYIANSSYPSCWYLEASATKQVVMSICAGYQSTGGDISEYVITEELRPYGESSDDYLVMYECLSGEELDVYQYTEEDGYSDYVTQYPNVLIEMNYGWVSNTEQFLGFGVGYNSLIRGIIDFDPVSVDYVGYFVVFEYSTLTETITKSTKEFAVDEMIAGTHVAYDYIDDPPNPNTTVERRLCHACPQVVAPRYWPHAAGVEHIRYNFSAIPTLPDSSLTIYPGARCLTGEMSCTTGVPGTLTFPTSGTLKEVLNTTDSGGITGCRYNVLFLHDRHRMDVRLYDHSPGGSIVLIYYRLRAWSGDIDVYPPETFTHWAEYYVRLFVNGHEVTLSPYETDATWAHLWGEDCHAVHKHPSEDDYWLYCVGERATEESAWTLKCYRDTGGEHWTSPESTYGSPPTVLWSSDRWIYVTNLFFDYETIEMVTRGVWPQRDPISLQGDHGDWLISHNKHDHPTEDDMPYYVPAGLRYQPNGDWNLAEKWVCSDLQIDTVKTSRLLP